MRLITMLRSALHGPEVERARKDEREITRAEGSRRSQALQRIEEGLCPEDESLPILGHSLASGRAIRLPPEKLRCHFEIVGPSGVGKTRFVTSLIMALWSTGTHRLMFLDPKAEGVELALRAIIRHAASLAPAARKNSSTAPRPSERRSPPLMNGSPAASGASGSWAARTRPARLSPRKVPTASTSSGPSVAAGSIRSGSARSQPFAPAWSNGDLVRSGATT